jgi:cobalt/nickel transport system permease protein
MNFVEKTLAGLLDASEYAASAERMASTKGVLQATDPRVKIAGLLTLLVVAASTRQLILIAGIFLSGCALALLSRVPLRKLAAWVWTPVLLFTGVIALPSVFLLHSPRSAAFLLSRAETAATLSTLLVLTTPWPRVLKALRWFRCPAIFVVILGMTYRYIFVILQTALEMLESRKSRTVGVLPPADARRLAASSVGVLLSKSVALSSDVHMAMLSRGFRGEIHILDDGR